MSIFLSTHSIKTCRILYAYRTKNWLSILISDSGNVFSEKSLRIIPNIFHFPPSILMNLPCKICCCKPTACNWCSRCNEAGEIDSVVDKIGLDCCGGLGNIDCVTGEVVAIHRQYQNT